MGMSVIVAASHCTTSKICHTSVAAKQGLCDQIINHDLKGRPISRLIMPKHTEPFAMQLLSARQAPSENWSVRSSWMTGALDTSTISYRMFVQL